MADDPTAGLDDAAIEALLGDVDKLDAQTLTPPDGWKPPSFEEWSKTQDSLRKANAGAKNVRLRLAELQGKGGGKPPTPAAMPPKPGTPAAGAPQGDPQPVDEAALRAAIEAEYKAKAEAERTQSAIVTALIAGGLALPEKDRAKAVRTAAKLVDSAGLTADDAAGIDAAVDALKGSFPGLFAAPAAGQGGQGGDAGRTPVRAHSRRLGGPGAAANAGTGNGQALTSAELLAQKIFGTTGK